MIKTFEEYGRNIPTYSVGDYLLIDIDGEEFKVKTKSFTTTYDTHVYVQFPNGESKNINIRRNIIRKLWTGEIKDFKLEEDSYKYNI